MVKRVTVLLTEEEYAQVRISAQNVPLSRWFKSLALNAKETNAEVDRIPDVPRNPAIRADRGRESTATSALDRLPVLGERQAPAKRATKTCVHGIAKGFNCWQCGGLAIVQS
jgi:hypothetical protein